VTAGKTRRPLILIGLDAMDTELVRQWAADGALPTFRHLYRNAARGTLLSPCSAMQGSIWPSFFTATNPARHGLYFMAQVTPGSYDMRRMRASDLQGQPFWTHPDVPAGPVAVVDVPKLGPVARPGDSQVVEWGALDHFSRFATTPAALAQTLPRHPLQSPLKAPWGNGGRQRLQRHLLAGIATKDALNRRLLRQRPDMLLTVFGETHAAGHYLWPRSDKTVQGTKQPDADGPLGGVYRSLDRTLGGLLEDFAGEANLILFSGHGMLADTIPSGVLESLLERMGLSVAPPDGAKQWGLRSHLARLGARLPYAVRRLSNEFLIPQSMQRQLMRIKGIAVCDPAASQAFALPSDHQGFIRINLQGREPLGRVAAADYDGICERIEEAVMQLRDANTGLAMVREVLRPQRLWPGGAQLDALPDLCVVWRPLPQAPASVLSGHGPIEAGRRHPERSGNHRLDGFFFAVGPDIDASAPPVTADLMDIGPTAMQLMRGSYPRGLDGSPLPVITGSRQ
jgi:predicted AlkP superfamily phosphohydrolase/phosphomutase